MGGSVAQQAPLRSALFVDFDNIYLTLKEDSPRAAERFATDPRGWVDWLAHQAWYTWQVGAPPYRRILLQRCYLNPRAFARYRPDFTRAAFQVVDCPVLTQRGKNSTDIHMVLDILDVLHHPTHFDEFIVLSGDADFTPVLLRLRAHDRRTVVLPGGLAAQAYRAAADHVIDTDDFVETALGVRPEPRPVQPPSPGAAAAPVLEQASRRLLEEVQRRGTIAAPELARTVLVHIDGFRDSNWFGFYSLRPLTEELVRRQPQLEIVDEADPWSVRLRARDVVAASEPAAPGAERIAHVGEIIAKAVRDAPEPIPSGVLAQLVQQELGDVVLESKWFGYGSFGTLLREVAERHGLAYSSEPPGYVYDPHRHVPPEEGSRIERVNPDIAPLALRLHQITGVPKLTPDEYADLFEAIVGEIQDNGFQQNSTSKNVRDRPIERGRAISRAAVALVVRGLRFAGVDLEHLDLDARGLAEAFENNVVQLCEASQLELGEQERTLLHRWIMGGFPQQDGTPQV